MNMDFDSEFDGRSPVGRFTTALCCAFACLLIGCHPKTDAQQSLAYLAQTDGYWKVWVSDLDGSDAKQLTKDQGDVSRISWFPDGHNLLVNLQDGRLFRVDAATGERLAIQTPMPGIQDAVISPNGKQIAFSYGANEMVYNNDVWMFDVASGAAAKLTAMPGLQHEPAWSADGKWLYFLSGNGGQFHDIWRLNLATRSSEQVTVNELYHFDLALNEEGIVAYSGNRSGNYDLWLRHPNGRSQALTNDVALDARPAWTPGEDSLLFESTRGGGMNVWSIDLGTKQLKKITQTKGGARMPIVATGRRQ